MDKSGRTQTIRKAPIVTLLSETKRPDDTISLGQGVPYFKPPNEAIQAAKKYTEIEQGFRYSPDEGIPSLRNVISKKLGKENNITTDPEKHIQVTSGANQAFMNTLMAITNPGDDIILFSPTYFNYVMAVKLVGCNPILLPTEQNGYIPDINQLENKITKKTKAIITISPNNPTGMVYPKDILEKINRLCYENGFYHISDEVYEYFTYEDAQHISPAQFDKGIQHTISIFSCSKSFAMSGYRIGFLVLPHHLYNDVLKVQDTIGICAPVPGQAAAIEALTIGNTYVQEHIGTINEIRTMFIKHLQEISNIDFIRPNGAMYIFLKLKTTKKSWDIAKQLIESYGVITILGEIFDVTYPSLRVSFGNLPIETSEKAMHRLINGLSEIL